MQVSDNKNFPLLDYKIFKDNKDLTNLLCYQAELKKVGYIPLEALAYLRDNKLNIDVLSLFNKFSTLEKTALYIEIYGFKKFIQAYPSPEAIFSTYKKIKEFIPAIATRGLNRLRWLEIRLSVLFTTSKAIPDQTIKCAISDNSSLSTLVLNKEDLNLGLLQELQNLLESIRSYAEINEKSNLAKILEHPFFQSDFLPFIISYFNPKISKEIVNLLDILKKCLDHSQFLFPFLLVYRPPVENFPSYQDDLIKDLYLISQYFNIALSKRFSHLKISNDLKKTFNEFTEQQNYLFTQTKIQKEKIIINLTQKNLLTLNQTEHNALLVQKCEACFENYIKWVSAFKKYTSLRKITLSIEEKALFNNVNNYSQYFNWQYKNINNCMNNIEKVIKNLIKECQGQEIKLSDYTSGIFSIGDLIKLYLIKDAKNIYEFISTHQLANSFKLTQLLEKITDVTFCDYQQFDYQSWTNKHKQQFYLANKAINQDYLKQVNLFKNKLKINKGLKEVSNLLIKRVNFLLNIRSCLENYFEAYSLIIYPLFSPQAQSIDLTSKEANLISEHYQLLTSNLINFIDPDFLTKIKENCDTFFSASYQDFLNDWQEKGRDLLQNKSFLLEVSISHYFTLVFEHLQFLSSIKIEEGKTLKFQELIINSIHNSFIGDAKSLLKFLERQDLLALSKISPKKRLKKRNRAKAKREIIATKSSSNFTLPQRTHFRPLLTLTSDLQHLEFTAASHQAQAIEKVYMEFQAQWKSLDLPAKLSLLHNLCKKLPHVLFQEVKSLSSIDKQNHLFSIKQNAVDNLSISIEDLITASYCLYSDQLHAFQLSFLVLKLSIAIEQALKLFSKQADQLIKSHQPSLIYQDLVEKLPDLPFPLPLLSNQKDWLKQLDAVIDLTGRYGTEGKDLITYVMAELNYLSQLENSSLTKEEQNQEKQLVTKELQENIFSFFDSGLEILKNIILASDAEQMIKLGLESYSSKALPFSYSSFSLKELKNELKNAHLSSLSHSTSLTALLNSIEKKLSRLNNINLYQCFNQDRNKFRLTILVNRSLINCEATLKMFQQLPSFSKEIHAQMWSINMLLREATLVENILHIMLAYSPLFGPEEDSCHLLFSKKNDKSFHYSHHLSHFFKALKPYLSSALSAQLIHQFNERLTFLEPILKNLYRYRDTSLSKANQMVTKLRLLEQMRFSFAIADQEQNEQFESFVKENSLSKEELTELTGKFVNKYVIKPLPHTLHMIDQLLTDLITRLEVT